VSILRQVLAHPSNAGHPWRTTARWVAHNVRRRLRPDSVMTTAVGDRVLSGPVDHPLMCFAVYIPAGRHDFDAFWAIERLLDAGDTFIDVGANIGIFSVQADPMVGPDGRIVAIEPAPGQAAFLRANLERLEAATTVVETAVAHDERRLGLRSPGPSTGFLADAGPGAAELTTTTLDAIVAALRPSVRPDRCVVKVDIEGWEPAAILGAGRLVTAGARAFLIEALDHQHRCEVPWADAVDLLHRHGYRFVWPDVRRGVLREFHDPPTRSPFGDYVAVTEQGYERLKEGLASGQASARGGGA
jgi:FkbM family methyltransferase